MHKLIKECQPIAGTDGYFIHITGRIFKVSEVAQYDNGGGYLYCKVDGGRKHLSVHREVAKAFLPNRENLATVDHIDGDKYNNLAGNLQWMSHGDNVRKAHTRQMTFVHKDGRVINTSNVRRFARDHNLDSSAVSKVISGKLSHTKGWRYKSDG